MWGRVPAGKWEERMLGQWWAGTGLGRACVLERCHHMWILASSFLPCSRERAGVGPGSRLGDRVWEEVMRPCGKAARVGVGPS